MPKQKQQSDYPLLFTANDFADLSTTVIDLKSRNLWINLHDGMFLNKTLLDSKNQIQYKTSNELYYEAKTVRQGKKLVARRRWLDKPLCWTEEPIVNIRRKK